MVITYSLLFTNVIQGTKIYKNIHEKDDFLW